jgi:hypothetical protein
MSQATLLGLCSDNVVTVLTPSSTIECSSGSCGFSGSCCDPCGSSGMKVVDVYSETVIVNPITGIGGVVLPLAFPVQATYVVTGSLQIEFTAVPSSWTTGPPLNIYLQIDLDNAANRIKRTVTFRYDVSGNLYSVNPVDLQFSFLIKDKAATTITVTPVNAGGTVTFEGSLWYQYVQYTNGSC